MIFIPSLLTCSFSLVSLGLGDLGLEDEVEEAAPGVQLPPPPLAVAVEGISGSDCFLSSCRWGSSSSEPEKARYGCAK